MNEHFQRLARLVGTLIGRKLLEKQAKQPKRASRRPKNPPSPKCDHSETRGIRSFRTVGYWASEGGLWSAGHIGARTVPQRRQEVPINHLLDLARAMREARRHGQDPGLAEEDMAFYDGLAESGSAREVMKCPGTGGDGQACAQVGLDRALKRQGRSPPRCPPDVGHSRAIR